MRAQSLQLTSTVLAALLLVSCSSAPKDEAKDQLTSPTAIATNSTPSTTPLPEQRQRSDAAPKADVVCTKKDDERTLTIQEIGSGCWMMYVNKGIKKRSAWSKKGNAHCEKVRDQIRGTLTKSGYTCK